MLDRTLTNIIALANMANKTLVYILMSILDATFSPSQIFMSGRVQKIMTTSIKENTNANPINL
jgi:hypothetical protein